MIQERFKELHIGCMQGVGKVIMDAAVLRASKHYITTLKPEGMRKEGFKEYCDWSHWGATQASMGTWIEGKGR